MASLSLALIILTWASIPGAVKSSAQTRFRKTFLRPKVKLLTEEEYISQVNSVIVKLYLNHLKELSTQKINAGFTEIFFYYF